MINVLIGLKFPRSCSLFIKLRMFHQANEKGMKCHDIFTLGHGHSIPWKSQL